MPAVLGVTRRALFFSDFETRGVEVDAMVEPTETNPMREVHCAEAIAWLRTRGEIANACVVTSLPDVSEVGKPLAEWRAWFTGAARLIVESVPTEGAAIFFQSDIKR